MATKGLAPSTSRERTRASSLKEKDENKVEEGPRVLKEREIINLFMSTGIYQNIAKSIVKNVPEMSTLTEKNSDDFKSIVREALNVLEKEGVPESIFDKTTEVAILPSDGSLDEVKTVRPKIALCKICKDSAVIHPAYPEKMKNYFKADREFRGTLTKEDWLCRGCYADFYRDNRDWIKDFEEGRVDEQSNEAASKPATSKDDTETEEEREKKSRKEAYIKNIAYLLLLVAKNLSPGAVQHRKMLVRYIAKGQIQVSQLASALYYLRKTGSGIIDQEEFEKYCGIGRYGDLFGYSSWKSKPAEREILHLNEAERNRRKQEKQQTKEAEERERKQKEEDERREVERQKQHEEQLAKATKEAQEKVKAEKWRKIQEARKKEDEEILEARKKADASREKQKDKREAERKASKKAREQELKEAEQAIRKKEEDLKRRQEERHRKQRQEAQQRASDRRTNAKLMNI